MLEAVNTIHEERIVHTDLKPANFLFVKGVLKLIDFGIAKAISDDTTNIHRENQVGTLNYISPEALIDTSRSSSSVQKMNMDMKLGRSSDIWSMGCILYQMVYGKTPFAELGLVHKLQAIVSDEYQISYPQVDSKYSNAIDVIKLCLQRDAKLRPSITGSNGLLEHCFLHPARVLEEEKANKMKSSSSNALLGNATFLNAMRHCLAIDNNSNDANMEQLKHFVSTILATGQEMERQQMNGLGLRASVADNIVEQLQQRLQATPLAGAGDAAGDAAGAFENEKELTFDATSAVQHAKDVELRAQRMANSKKGGSGGKSSRPVRRVDFVSQLKRTKSVLNKAPKLQKAKKTEPAANSLQAVLQQGFASRFAKSGMKEDEDKTLGNWTISDLEY